MNLHPRQAGYRLCETTINIIYTAPDSAVLGWHMSYIKAALNGTITPSQVHALEITTVELARRAEQKGMN